MLSQGTFLKTKAPQIHMLTQNKQKVILGRTKHVEKKKKESMDISLKKVTAVGASTGKKANKRRK